MQVVHPICCGIDVHQARLTACLRQVDADGQVTKDVREFATTYGALLTLLDWLEQIPRSARRNPLPVKRINGSLLMGHEHVSRALVELMQIRKTPSGTDRVLHHAPEAFDGIEVMATMGR